MTLLLGAWTMGLILALAALGVFITFKIFSFPDITVDGSFALGGAVAASLIVNQQHIFPFLTSNWWGAPLVSTLIAAFAGMIAGTITGVLHTKFKINGLLSGILVMTALYSINLRVMGRSNVPLLGQKTLSGAAENGAIGLFGSPNTSIWRWQVDVADFGVFTMSILLIAFITILLHLFFRTNLGASMRATGDNSQMISALGVNTSVTLIMGIALSNGLVAASGALLAQYQGFADVQMGIGMIVLGLAGVIIGEAMVGRGKGVGISLIGAVMGTILFRLLVAIALLKGLNPNDLKLITAVFVLIALIAPRFLGKLQLRRVKHA